MEVGDKVRYKTFEPIEKECECCGHIEIDYKEVEGEGVIESIGWDYVMNNGKMFEYKEEGNLKIPTFKEIKPPKKAKFYKVNGESITENDII